MKAIIQSTIIILFRLALFAIRQGVLQDHAKAHMWYNLAAANGNEIGRKNRDIIAKNMTSDQTADAQNLQTPKA
jgi:TPR repeat protein